MLEQKRYSLEKAQEEAFKLQEKIQNGEAKDYSKAEKLVEKEKKEKQQENKKQQIIEEYTEDEIKALKKDALFHDYQNLTIPLSLTLRSSGKAFLLKTFLERNGVVLSEKQRNHPFVQKLDILSKDINKMILEKGEKIEESSDKLVLYNFSKDDIKPIQEKVAEINEYIINIYNP